MDAFLNRDHDMLLFFHSPDGGLSPVIRPVRPSSGFGDAYVEPGSGERDPTGPAGPAPTEKVVLALLSGPGRTDSGGRSDHRASRCPRGRNRGGPGRVGRRDRGAPALAVQGLDATAVRQLTCTIAYNEATDGRGVVTLTGQDGAKTSRTCGLAPGTAG